MNLLSSFRPLLATATGTAVLVLLFAIDLQSQPSTSRQVTVTPSAADYAAAAAARNVRVHLRPANTPVGRKTSVAAISLSGQFWLQFEAGNSEWPARRLHEQRALTRGI